MDSLDIELDNIVNIISESENLDEDISLDIIDTETYKNISDENTSLDILDGETFKNNSDDICTDIESVSGTKPTVPQVTSNETLKNQIMVFEPNSPVMERFQNTLKKHLLKQREIIKNELHAIDGAVRIKQNEKSSSTIDSNKAACRVETQHTQLKEMNRIISGYSKDNMLYKEKQKNLKNRYNEITAKTEVETDKISSLNRQLDNKRGLLKELLKYEHEQKNAANMFNQKKSQAKQYTKKLLNEQQKQNLLLSCLTQEILHLEDRLKNLGDQAGTKYKEREVLEQKVMDKSIDLETINKDNIKITSLWNDVLKTIQQRDEFLKEKRNDYQKAKGTHNTILVEANSYKRSAQEVYQKNDDLHNTLNKMKREQDISRYNYNMQLDHFSSLKNEYTKLIQIAEFQNINLNDVMAEIKSIKTDSKMLLNSVEKKTNIKSKLDEEILEDLKTQSFTNKVSVNLNKKITEIKNQNKLQEKSLVDIENNLCQDILKLEQHRTTIFELEKDIDKNNKQLNMKESTISTLHYELKTLYAEIQNKSKQCDLEHKQLDTVNKRNEDGHIGLHPKLKINQTKFKIDEVRKEIDLLKQSWIQKQNKIAILIDQSNKQSIELNKMRKNALVLDNKKIKLEKDLNSLFKEVDHYKQTLINMRSIILKLNENFSQNKGKSSQLLNENEWKQYSNFAELKESEKQCLELMDKLKVFKSELDELKNVLVEKQRESKSWITKVHLLSEMKKSIKRKEGDSGDIHAMKSEIHRAQLKESQLQTYLEKIMLDLEGSISRRETIYNKVAATESRLRRKNESKQKFLKKLDDLRKNIKKIKIECKKLEKRICDSKHRKMELESKLTDLNDRLTKEQTIFNDLMKNIEDTGANKQKNIHNLSYKQNHAKFLDEVKKEKYNMLIKGESKLNEELLAERKKNSDLISVVETLKYHIPFLDLQLTHVLNILNSVEK